MGGAWGRGYALYSVVQADSATPVSYGKFSRLSLPRRAVVTPMESSREFICSMTSFSFRFRGEEAGVSEGYS